MKLLFIPGSGSGKEAWVYQTKHFAGSEAGALPGHPDGKPCDSIEEYTDWLHGYITGKKYKDVVLAGHSLGGAIVLTYALKYGSELKGLILLGTGARLRVSPAILDDIRSMIGNDKAWRKHLTEFYTFADQEATRAGIEARVKIGPAAMLNDFLCCDKFDVMARVPEVKVPTFILCGSNDEMTPPKYSQYLAGKIAGSKMTVIDGATHAAPREKPQEVNAAIAGFLATLK